MLQPDVFLTQGTFLVMQHFVQAMVKHNVDRGSIVNLASIVVKTCNMGLANYVSSKAGVDSMTRVACKEFGKFNIRVNAVLPGYINTPFTKKIPDKIIEQVLQSSAMRRFGEPEGKRNVSRNKANYRWNEGK